MADTAHLSLMLGPFEDRELEPHEYRKSHFTSRVAKSAAANLLTTARLDAS